ncbi:intradiol ring-cleavage dioxygenase [Microterricola viridarii]|uniref:3,4-dioxygenase subunit beta n=1 Tax=Microterricola viridarii TaxID=412690 RepID=A0A120I147_9MICO|nr:intradiol ring-cleavage dioxygenase [Microterricola viridarii]AMB60410.1 3,4-dioxygenase subunit beta [Microterricola viridarii]
MHRIPEPDSTPDGPAFEGRLLERAHEEVVDQGVAFDIGTLMTRRGVLTVFGAGLGAVLLAACTPGGSGNGSSSGATTGGSSGTASGEIPDETAGPYPGDGSNGPDALEQSGIIRSDIRTSIDGGATATGVPMALTLTIIDMAGNNVPFANVAVYVWHCDSAGGYSMYSSGLEDVTYLRGVQVADAEGTVSYTSIFPACYSGRWPHVHFEVYPNVDAITDSTAAISTSQLALPEDVCKTVYALPGYEGSAQNLAQVSLATDGVFGDDGGALQLATVTGDATSGYQVSLTVPVDTRTTPTSGGMPGGGGGGGGTPPSGGPGGGPGGTPPAR